ncbi:metal ABC transporter solute-binding protein, Zn/Mn family [Virgibacillus sp. MSJ-26]|uniref:metal ABC transporter solute-binding protein, Zn/Mn family n=1 Tax=Virgibacillus sp. MSJ-26 TaxID=2841522 RepID=UPI0020A05E7B|nr:zinc ABC transporter substrate-binding protein [Virgibacillus sp. MSJ-26]
MKDMKKGILGVLMAGILMFILAACGSDDNAADDTKKDDDNGDEPLHVVTSFTIISDMAEQIGGDIVEVHNLVPTGTDPHEYEPLPDDIKKATDADVLFYNGLNLEGGKNGWFFKMVDSVGQDEDRVFSLTEQVEPMYIGGEEGTDEEINPHSFIDPDVGIMMAEDMRDALIEVDPDNEDHYKESAGEYINRLEEIVDEYEEKINEIPEEKRILVTSERAFQYMADRFGLEEGYIWEIDTEENGSPEQIKTLVNYLTDHDVPMLFVESNVDERPMETVSNESGIPIFEKPIYSDEIGEKGSEVDTYVKYLNYNIDVISEGLNQ